MGLLQDAIDRLLSPIFDKIKQAFAPFGKLVDFVFHFWTKLQEVATKINSLIALVISEVNEWKNFKENLAFRTKVTNASVLINGVQEFWQQMVAAWNSIQDLVKEIKGKFAGAGEDPADEVRAAIKDVEESGFKDILAKFPRLLKGAEKVLGFVAIVLDALTTILAAIDDLTTIAEALKAIREDIETGGPLFLKQSNPRRTVRLEDGTSMKIRVGNLHS